MNKQILLLTGIAILLLTIPFARATSPPIGTWNVYYYSDHCGGTSWSPTVKDGGGFAANAPPNDNNDPQITAPGTVYVRIVVTGGAADAEVTYRLDGGNSPFPDPVTFSLDSSGNADECIQVDVTVAMANAVEGPSCTVPQQIWVTDDGSGNLDHLILLGSDNGNGCGGGENFPQPPTVTKDATGSYTTTYTWTIQKDVDKTLVKQVGGTATFTYTITVTHDPGTDSDVKVTGTIDVINPNLGSITGDVTDKLSDGTTCTVTGGSGATLATGDNYFDYECDLSAVPTSQLDNTATVTWDEQPLSSGGTLAAGSASYTFQDITFTQTLVDDCISVDDSYAGHLGDVCVGGDNPATFNYQLTVNVPQWDCVSYDNTATYTTDDTGATDSASQTVTVCGPVQTGALTMGFWKNKNGQNIIKGAGPSTGTCSLTPWLRNYAPFEDLSPTATCSVVASYVNTVVTAASAGGSSMNAMLKAQMLATALDVYFSDTALGGNKIGAPGPIGSVEIDLTKICKNIPTCTVYEDVSPAFGGASSLTVQEMLTYAASQSTSGGSTWYGNVKATQELAKDAFDAINNQVAFGVV
jgi:hypothetical protein